MSELRSPHSDDESQPLTEDSGTFSDSLAKPRRSSSTASTTSLIFDRIGEHDPLKNPKHFHDDEDAHARDPEFEELDIEDASFYRHGKPADTKYRRWMYMLGALCCAGWILAFVVFLANGSYRHRSTVAHDPDATGSAGSGKRITLDQVQSGFWSPTTHSISWIASPDGADGLLLEKGGAEAGKDYLVVEDVRSRKEGTEALERKVLMKTPSFQVNDNWIYASEVWPSPDFKTVLVQSSRQHNWRHSTTGLFWLFDVETQTGQPLDPAKPNARMQLATWSPKSDAVVFTRDNNMFLRRLADEGAMQITKDGGDQMFNGVPDWVYEEEVFSGDSATWFSEDGNYIAFLATDESGVPEYPVQYFLSRPSGQRPSPGQESYPEVRKIKYPKAGAPNPIVHLRFYDVENSKVFNVPIDHDFEDDDRLITEVIWAGSTGKVLIRETNRESDVLKMVLIDVVQREGRIVREHDVMKLDGGWFEVSETTTFIPKDADNGRPNDGYIDTIIHDGYDHLAYFSPLDADSPTVMLTSGEWEVINAPSAVDLQKNLVYFDATRESSIQRHSYHVSLLDGANLTPLTDTSHDAVYEVTYSHLAGFALMTYKGPAIPWQKVVSTPSNSDSFSHTIEENKKLASEASAHELPRLRYTTMNIEGTELNVMERLPPHFDSSRQYPVLFYLYGGPGSQTVSKAFHVDFQSYVASALGYIVVTVDGRGTGFIGRKARCIIRGNIGYYEAYDQIATAKEWAKKPYVDARRIAIWGWSYGGFLTLKTLEQDAGNTFHYGMAVAPVTNWKFYDSIYTERWMHTPQHNPSGYTNASVSNVTAISQNVRFLMMHGTGDDNVHIQNSLTLLDELDLGGVENYDVHVFPDSDHSIYFHNANRIVYDKLRWWLINAFNGEWERIKEVRPISKGEIAGGGH
ncbi:MAG: hypothetical protein Q9162_003123 [Coniocarpon cinnabarinum]